MTVFVGPRRAFVTQAVVRSTSRITIAHARRK